MPSPTTDPSRRAVVTGLGTVSPLGIDTPSSWDALREGRSGVGPITRFDPADYPTHFAAQVPDSFDPHIAIDKKLSRRLDPYARFSLVAAREAILDAGLDTASMTDKERARAGVTFGAGMGGMHIYYEQAQNLMNYGPSRVSPFFIPMLITDMIPGLISMEYGLRGPNYAIVSACATGNNNIGEAVMLIQAGRVDVMVTGSGDASVNETGVAGFTAMKAMSTRNNDPQTASRPFDLNRDGFVMGEGAGALVVESLAHAQARGARIYCEITGLGMSADAYHITAPHPEGIGAALGMQGALDDASLNASDVDYLNMHGTSTPLGDIAETNAIKHVFGEHAYTMSLSSTKSMTGHMLGAAGSFEAIASILAIHHNVIPPTINFETADPQCDLDYTFNEAKEKDVKIAVSNAFGFGGHNTSVVFERFEG